MLCIKSHCNRLLHILILFKLIITKNKAEKLPLTYYVEIEVLNIILSYLPSRMFD